MANYQASVTQYRPAGVSGDKATPNQSIYFPRQLFAEGDVFVGTFVQFGTDPATQAKAGGTKPIGFVERNIVYPNVNVLNDGTLQVPKGYPLTIAVRGDYYVTSTTAGAMNDKVFANTTTGVVTFGSGTAPSGTVDTGWVVRRPGAAGEPVLISNWTPTTAA
mgnify:CR=1 FL=1|jgi:hypothetical protein